MIVGGMYGPTCGSLEHTTNRLPAGQSATTLGSGVDGAVRSIALGYDNLSRQQNITSYGGTGGTGTVVNDVQFAYNDFGQVATTYQSHGGAVNTSTSPNVQSTYDTTTTGSVFSAQHRRQTIVYPNGRTVYLDYGTSGAAYDALSKVRTIRDTGSTGTALATYDYNGAGSRLAMVTLPQPSLKLDLFQGTSGTYAGLDRFGRVIDQYWKGSGSTADADRIHYGYDDAGSRTYRDIDSAIYSTNDKDQAYTYDGLHRLGTLQQGTLSGTSISGTPASEEDWTLDALGNWPNYVTKAAGATTLSQGRTVNGANEITAISASVGSTWATPAYDAAGNMTTIPQPANLTSGYTATYDAWNRLVKLADGANTVQENQYDGRHFRIVIKSYSGGTLSETRHSYFTDDWRVIEERIDAATTAERQFVWGGRYIDDLVLRDRDTDANGSLEERLYALQDANWNVTAIANASGAVQERYLYAGYGVPMFLNASFSGIPASADAWETLFGGYRYDGISGMCLVRNRVYHPAVGGWCQRDPINYRGGSINLYSYVRGNPTGAFDSSGLADKSWPTTPYPAIPDTNLNPDEMMAEIAEFKHLVNNIQTFYMDCYCKNVVTGCVNNACVTMANDIHKHIAKLKPKYWEIWDGGVVNWYGPPVVAAGQIALDWSIPDEQAWKTSDQGFFLKSKTFPWNMYYIHAVPVGFGVAGTWASINAAPKVVVELYDADSYLWPQSGAGPSQKVCPK